MTKAKKCAAKPWKVKLLFRKKMHMKYTPGILREVLHSLIRKLGETPEQFVRRPGRDFTRPRTLSFEMVISPLLTMSENSVGKALIKRFKSRENTPSALAFEHAL